MAHAWKACWVNALGGSNPPSSAGRRAREPQQCGARALRHGRVRAVGGAAGAAVGAPGPRSKRHAVLPLSMSVASSRLEATVRDYVRARKRAIAILEKDPELQRPENNAIRAQIAAMRKSVVNWSRIS